MNPSDFSGLLPLGGAGILLVYLLKILIEERRYWVAERTKLMAENEELKVRHVKELEAKDKYWKRRCEEAERKAYGIGEVDDP